MCRLIILSNYVVSVNCRTTFHELVAKRKESYIVLQPRNKTSEEYLEAFLKENILILWPDGWMKFEELKKECFKSTNKKPKENKKPSENTNSVSVSLVQSSSSITLTSSTNDKASKESKIGETSVEKLSSKITITKTDRKQNDITSKITSMNAMPSPINNSSLTITATDACSSVTKALSNAPSKVIAHVYDLSSATGLKIDFF